MHPITSVDAVLHDDQCPHLEEYDVLFRGDTWVALSSNEAIVIRLLLDRFERVVGRDRLVTALWPREQAAGAPLNQQIVRVRRRIRPLDLEIGTVRGRGYVLRYARPDADRVMFA